MTYGAHGVAPELAGTKDRDQSIVRRYSEFEIAVVLNRLRRGEPLSAIAKVQDVPERVIRAWENRFLNLSAAEIREARALKAENRRLRVRIRRLRDCATRSLSD